MIIWYNIIIVVVVDDCAGERYMAFQYSDFYIFAVMKLYIIILYFINASIMYNIIQTSADTANGSVIPAIILYYIYRNMCTYIIHINECVCVCVRSRIRGAKYLTPSVYTRGGCAVNVKGTRMAAEPWRSTERGSYYDNTIIPMYYCM